MDKIIGALLTSAPVQKLMLEMTKIVSEKLTALLPVIIGAATKAFGDVIAKALKDAIPHIEIPAIPAVPDIIEAVREDINKIPDIDIPVLSDIFDLTEWLKGKAK
jgi:hypothetical protein